MAANDAILTLDIEAPYIGSAFSPTVDIDSGEYEHTVTITDARGEHSYTVPTYLAEEEDRQDAERLRDAAELRRGQNEAARVSAESARVTAENQRDADEEVRQNSELDRQGAESTRQQNEINRESTEATRRTDEADRVIAERARASAENARAQGEGGRELAERYRQQNEQSRNIAMDHMSSAFSSMMSQLGTSEAARVTAEDGRVSAEAERVAAEQGRVTAEEGRVTAEEGRVTAEAARVAAEQEREAYFETIEARIDAKADADAYAPQLLAGAAEALTGNDAQVSTWARRTSERDGAARVASLRGNTVVWNQLAPIQNSSVYRGVTYTSNNDGTITANGESVTGDSYRTITFNAIAGHVYLSRSCPQGGSSSTYMSYLTQQGFAYNNHHDTGNGAFNTPTSSGSAQFVYAWVKEGVTVTDKVFKPQLFDLTLMFGAGNEPATVAEFERMFPESYYPYDPGSLLSVNVEGIESAGTTREIPASTYFPNGMRSAGSVYDELTEDAAVTRVGSRAYESGDESDASAITDGTTTYYALSTPVVVNIDPPLNLTYLTEQGGTESIVVPEGSQSAPPTWAIAYGYTAEGLRDEAQSIIAPVEHGTANANYAVGSYLIMDGTLYRVTSAIATGESITSSNVTATTVMAEIVRLTA